MAQKIFQSMRRLPGHFSIFRKKAESINIQGVEYRIGVYADYGYPEKPTSLAYDPVLDLLAVLTRHGLLYIYGKPGVMFSASHSVNSEFIQVFFISGTRRLVTLTDSDDLYLWELASCGQSVHLVTISTLCCITKGLHHCPTNFNSTDADTSPIHVTALCCASDNKSILIGTDSGLVASVRLNFSNKIDESSPPWSLPTADDAITPTRILNDLSADRRQRLRADEVVVLSERPGFPGQVLIGYSSGLSLIFDLRSDRVVALLPWQHGLEASAWCGGSGFPCKVKNTSSPIPYLGTRLLTAYSDGSLGVWNLKEIGFTALTSPATSPPVLTMEEAPSMPYGPFPCKLISKVFWLPSPFGGITAFVGGMPRNTYGERHTVSVLRGSNLDRAATANVVAARLAAAAEAEDEDELVGDNPVSLAPIHVFDSDAPEHVCFDLPSPLVDIIPVGPNGEPVQLLLILCEEELVAVDLMSPEWPFMRPPYMTCLHTAPITTYNLVTQVNPTFLAQLEAAGSAYGPEGNFGRGSAVIHSPTSPGWSTLPWPIQGGQALVSGSRLSPSLLGGNLFTDDLLLTGHEDGSVAFWRLCAGGCLRRIYTLHSAIYFEGDFGLQDATHGTDDDADAWPPFRQAGVFDPFMDDSRVAVQVIQLIDNTIVVGGAAGQVITWQFLNFSPPLKSTTLTIQSEIPGFQWKGYSPLNVRPCFDFGNVINKASEDICPPQLQATGIVLVQPPTRITALLLTQLRGNLTTGENLMQNTSPTGYPALVAVGTPHGFGVVYVPKPNSPPRNFDSSIPIQWPAISPQSLLSVSTLPNNMGALQEAAVGEGWARRRTRELKKSLRDSFRRLKRVRSTKSSNSSTANPPSANISRAGLRRTVTQSNRPTGYQTNLNPFEEAEKRSGQMTTSIEKNVYDNPLSVEREVCDRPLDSANVAIVSCFSFGPPLFRTSQSSSQLITCPVGSLFVGTKAGIVKAYAIFSDENSKNSKESHSYRLQLSKELILHHRAPVLSIRLVDKLNRPLSASNFSMPQLGTAKNPIAPYLLVVSEEQVRLFNLPSLHFKYKARITANDGYRIKAATLVGFRSQLFKSASKDNDVDSACGSAASCASATSFSDQPVEYAFVFSNVGGQSVVLTMPQLRRKDTLTLLNANDVVAVNSVIFSEPGVSDYSQSAVVIAPALGLYQSAPGQLCMFDLIRTGQKSSALGAPYRSICRLPAQMSASRSAAMTALENTSQSKSFNGDLTPNNDLTSGDVQARLATLQMNGR